MSLIKMHLEIIRIEDSFEYGVFGNLLIGTEAFCMTLEPREWDNERNVSCIPPGQYECARVLSPSFGTTYEICNVPNRSHVLFHKGNSIEDTEGCVLLAEKLGKLKGDRGILNSGKTFKDFMNKMQSYPEFRLTVKEVWK